MKQETYSTMLGNILRTEYKKEENKTKRTSYYKSLEFKRTGLKREITKIDRCLDRLRGHSWSKIDKKIQKFNSQFTNLNLIFDVKKRQPAKIKLLKKWGLWQ